MDRIRNWAPRVRTRDSQGDVMARKEKRIYFLIKTTLLEEMIPRDLLDMLRYDHAVIESNPPPGFYLLSSERYPTEARWKVFHVPIERVSTSDVELKMYVSDMQRENFLIKGKKP